MKKAITMITFLCLAVSSHMTFAGNNEDESNSWKRDNDNKLKARASSYENSVDGIIGSFSNAIGTRELYFSLVWENKKFCQDKDDDFSGKTTAYVNGQSILFHYGCHENQWVNFKASNKKGIDFIIREFNSNRNKMVEFTIQYPNSDDWSIHIPNKNFSSLYQVIKASTNDTL
jgi:hypothetical protein